MAERRMVDRDRMVRDKQYLLTAACGALLGVDPYQRGLVTSQKFSQALNELGLYFGSPETDPILEFCTFTDDGYVHYKHLMQAVAPLTPRAKQTTAKQAIYPEDRDARITQRASSARALRQRCDGTEERGEEVRKLFSRWELARLSDDELVMALEGLGFHITNAVYHLLRSTAGTRQLPLGKLMQALQVDENDGRKSRSNAVRDLSPRRGANSDLDVTDFDRIRSATCEFIGGKISIVSMRGQLRSCGVTITSELDKLLRQHENDGCGSYQAIIGSIMRQLAPPSVASEAPRRQTSNGFLDRGDSSSLGSHAGGSRHQSYPETQKSVRTPWATSSPRDWKLDADVAASPRGRAHTQPISWNKDRDFTRWDDAIVQDERRQEIMAYNAQQKPEDPQRYLRDCLEWTFHDGGYYVSHSARAARSETGRSASQPSGHAVKGWNEYKPLMQSAPFGRSTDERRAPPARTGRPIPFGTDVDHWTVMQEPSSDEYRPPLAYTKKFRDKHYMGPRSLLSPDGSREPPPPKLMRKSNMPPSPPRTAKAAAPKSPKSAAPKAVAPKVAASKAPPSSRRIH